MRLLKDDMYIFSVSAERHGKIVACRAKDSSEAIGKSVYKHLGMSPAEIGFFQREIESVGKMSIVALGKDKAVLFFKHFAYATGLCLAVVLDLPVESVSVIMRGQGFKSLVISEGLKTAAPAERCLSTCEDKQGYSYLAETVGLLEALACLRLQRSLESIATLRGALICAGELVGVGIECTVGEVDEVGFYCERPEIFDGRFCAACFLTLSMIARMHSRDRRLICEIAAGLDSLLLNFRFDAFGDGWRDGIELLKSIALGRHGMEFDCEFHEGTVTVALSPFYSDVGFVGVKQDEVFAGIEELGELY